MFRHFSETLRCRSEMEGADHRSRCSCPSEELEMKECLRCAKEREVCEPPGYALARRHGWSDDDGRDFIRRHHVVLIESDEKNERTRLVLRTLDDLRNNPFEPRVTGRNRATVHVVTDVGDDQGEFRAEVKWQGKGNIVLLARRRNRGVIDGGIVPRSVRAGRDVVTGDRHGLHESSPFRSQLGKDARYTERMRARFAVVRDALR